MIDINYNSEVKRKAPEADIPIYNILDINYILGGAANVAVNLKNLGVDIEIISIVGSDIYGKKIKNILNYKQIRHNLFVDNERKTTQKNRIFYNNQLNVRYDIESNHDISSNIEEDIIKYIKNKEKKLDAIIISDYDKGLISETLCKNIIDYSNANDILTFIDPKIKNYTKYQNCFLFKPNLNEAEIITGETNIDKIMTSLKEKIKCENILLTRGKEGMLLNNCNNKIQHENIINLIDVTGAGDIVMSVLVYSYLTNKDLKEASEIANYVGGKSVSVIGNYNVSIDDINEYYQLKNMQEKIKNSLNNDNTNTNTNINNKIIYDHELNKIKSIIDKNKDKNIVFTNGCFDILHSAHIELLQFSKKQGDILVVGLNSDDSIKRLKGEQRPINNIEERSKILSLFDFVDYIIIFCDDTPLSILKTLKPNILIKGSDYKKEDIIGREYVNNIILFDYIKNKSSSIIINKIKNI